MTGKGPVDPYPVHRLINHKDYAVEVVTSIIKETDLDPCGGHTSEDLGASGLYDLSREIENKERAQYSEAICTLNQDLMVKTKALVEDTRWLEEAEKAKTNLATKLASHRFKDCLKQVRVAHPNLDFPQIAIDTSVPPTPKGGDTVSDETVDSTHTVEQEVETDGMVIAQPAPGGLDGLPSKNPTTIDDLP
nr:hypothetical protein CFP56_56655 [Quercus suber]